MSNTAIQMLSLAIEKISWPLIWMHASNSCRKRWMHVLIL